MAWVSGAAREASTGSGAFLPRQAHHAVVERIDQHGGRMDDVGGRGFSPDRLRGCGSGVLSRCRCGCRCSAGHGHEQQHHQHRRAGARRQGEDLSAPEDGDGALARLDLGHARLLDGGERGLRVFQPIAKHDVRRQLPLLVLQVVSGALVGLGELVER